MVYRFDNYELDTDRQELRRRGELVKIERQALRVLEYLVRHRHRVVTKQELADEVWLRATPPPGKEPYCVTDEALARCLRLVRRALGDSGRAQKFIRTMYGCGYRFLATTIEEDLLAVASSNGKTAPHTPTASSVSTVDYTRTVRRPPSDPYLSDRPTMATEWKPVTVLSCAVTNLAALRKCLSSAEQHSLLYEFFTFVQGQVQQYGGSMQHATDNSFLALFGVPVPYEDHSWRALHVAMTLQGHLHTSRMVPRAPSGETVELRIGLHTGRVVGEQMGNDRRVTYRTLGDTTQLAVCLQQVATPGAILLSPTTAPQVQNAVRLEPLGYLDLPGETVPTLVHQVLAARSRRAAQAWHVTCPLHPFVGRRWELERLQATLERAMSGQGQVVSIVSEPGMGKSRLLHEFRYRLRGQKVMYLEGHCSAYDGALPYGPVREIIRQLCRLSGRDTLEVSSKKLRRVLEDLGLDSDIGAQCLLQLLGMQPRVVPPCEGAPEAGTVQAFDLLRRMCLKGSQHQPLVLAVENLHWIDPASATLLAMLIDILAGMKLLLLTTSRLDYQPPWIAKSYTTQIILSSLSPEESRTVVNAVGGTASLPEQKREKILTKAKGNPFFLEELTRAAQSSRMSDCDTVPVPDTIRNVLMARLGRLPEAQRRLLQTAAVLGQSWRLCLLEALWDDQKALPSLLLELQGREFLYEETAASEPSYAFRDVLMQEVAYDSLVSARQQALHEAAVRALDTLYGECREDMAEFMAYHRQRLCGKMSIAL